jgi:beta-lactam-binding protein with PASTA domain
VTTQNPAAGHHSDEQQRVQLTVTCPLTAYKGYAVMPDVTHKTRFEARQLLSDAGLRDIRFVGTRDTYCPVISATPPPGAVVRASARITLTTGC